MRLIGGRGPDALAGGPGDDRLHGRRGADSLMGAGGADRLFGDRGADELLGGEGADRLTGRRGADRLEGGPGDDLLRGGRGSDTLFGGAGDDVLRDPAGRADRLMGGAGDDLLAAGGRGALLAPGLGRDEARGPGDAALSYAELEVAVIVDLRAGLVRGEGLRDLVSGVSAAQGGAGDDRLLGGARRDWEGFRGGPGDDRINGRGGYDEAAYHREGTGRGIEADLETGEVIDPHGDLDRLRGVEAIAATRHVDLLQGGGAPYESFRGLAGDDLIDGRGGADRVDHSLDFEMGGEAGVRVDLRRGLARDGFGDRDRLAGIENARGGPADDVLRGDGGANFLQGEAGRDRLLGRAGRDRLEGGAGADALSGGPGADLFRFAAGDGRDRILDFQPGRDHLSLAGFEGISGFHELRFAARDGDALLRLPGGDAVRFDDLAPGDLSAEDVWLV